MQELLRTIPDESRRRAVEHRPVWIVTGPVNNLAGFSALKRIRNVLGYTRGDLLYDGSNHILPNNVQLKGMNSAGTDSYTLIYVDPSNSVIIGTGAAAIGVVNHVIPVPDNTWDLGAPTVGWRRGYFSSGAWLDFGNNNARLTHSTGLLTSSVPIALPGDPASALHAATKQYVDNLAAGLDVKQSVRIATTTAGTLASSFEDGDTVDGVTLATGDRILIKNQAAPAENGIYVVAASGAPARAADMDNWLEVPGSSVWVEDGTANADTAWVCTSNAGGTLNTTAIDWTQFGGTGAFQALNALLTSISALGANGLIARTSSSAAAARSIAAGNGTSVADGDGVSGNPTVNWKPNRNIATYSTNEDINDVIPTDTSVPQIGEGVEKATAALTIQHASSRVRVTVSGVISCATATVLGTVAIFRDAVANSIGCQVITVPTNNGLAPVSFSFEDTPGATGVTTYRLRVGVFNNAFNVRFNGTSEGTITQGGTMPLTMIVEEIPTT